MRHHVPQDCTAKFYYDYDASVILADFSGLVGGTCFCLAPIECQMQSVELINN